MSNNFYDRYGPRNYGSRNVTRAKTIEGATVIKPNNTIYGKSDNSPLVLLVDDDLTRRDRFVSEMPDSIFYMADNPLEGIRLLRTMQYDYIFLDHDLKHRDLDGLDVVVNYLLSPNVKTPTFVHSANPSGADRMVGVLERFGVPVAKYSFYLKDFWVKAHKFLSDYDYYSCVEDIGKETK